MSFQFGGLKTNINVSGAVSTNYAVPDMSTVVPVTVFFTGNNTVQTAYTVAAGKRFFVYGLMRALCAGTSELTLYQTDGTTVILKFKLQALSDVGHVNNQVLSMPIPMAVYAAGESVKIKEASSCDVGVFGLLVTV